MHRCLSFIGALLAALSLISAPAVAEKRVALVVGNAAYRNAPKLDNPANDAKLMAETLRGLGFTLVGGGPQLDLDQRNFRDLVRTFGNQLQGADVGFFYYAGHAVQLRGLNLLAPIDANPLRDSDATFELIDVDLVLREMDGAGPRLNVVILDASRKNPFGGLGMLRGSTGGLAQLQAPPGFLISLAAQPDMVAQDGADGDSPFTKALAQAFLKPGLGLFDAFNEVGLAVKRATGGSQQPWLTSSPIDGSFYFGGAPSASFPPAASVAPGPAVAPVPLARPMQAAPVAPQVAALPLSPPAADIRAPVEPGRRFALVIGNDRYANLSPDKQLSNAVNDARAVKATLEGLRFEVLYGENLDRSALVNKLSDMAARLGKDDIAFFYFAGHGVSFSGANYLLPSDIPTPHATGRAEEARLADQAIAETQVIDRITGSGARVAIVVLDACRDNPLQGADTRSLGNSRGLTLGQPAQGVFSIYSAGFGQGALDRLGPDDRNPNSVFTRVFIEKLKTPGLDLKAVATETRRAVVELAQKIGQNQFPAYYDQISGDVYLAGRPGP